MASQNPELGFTRRATIESDLRQAARTGIDFSTHSHLLNYGEEPAVLSNPSINFPDGTDTPQMVPIFWMNLTGDPVRRLGFSLIYSSSIRNAQSYEVIRDDVVTPLTLEIGSDITTYAHLLRHDVGLPFPISVKPSQEESYRGQKAIMVVESGGTYRVGEAYLSDRLGWEKMIDEEERTLRLTESETAAVDRHRRVGMLFGIEDIFDERASGVGVLNEKQKRVVVDIKPGRIAVSAEVAGNVAEALAKLQGIDEQEKNLKALEDLVVSSERGSGRLKLEVILRDGIVKATAAAEHYDHRKGMWRVSGSKRKGLTSVDPEAVLPILDRIVGIVTPEELTREEEEARAKQSKSGGWVTGEAAFDGAYVSPHSNRGYGGYGDDWRSPYPGYDNGTVSAPVASTKAAEDLGARGKKKNSFKSSVERKHAKKQKPKDKNKTK